MEKICSNCRYSFPIIDGHGTVLYWECRFNPPSVVGHSVGQAGIMFNLMMVFPRMKKEDWCFQFKAAGENRFEE